jgi:hypothetical protein
MPDYFHGVRRPEPGRPINIISQPAVNVDTNAIAEAVIKALEKKMAASGRIVERDQKVDNDFDNKESLERLANAMIVENKNESNLSGLGKVKETKKDNKETDKTIDLLSELGD